MITLVLVNVLLTTSLVVAIGIIKEQHQRLTHEIKHSVALENTINDYVKND